MLGTLLHRLRGITSLSAAIAAAVSGARDFPPPVFKVRRRDDPPHLHPTKGWRGDGTKPRGTNNRRRKA